MPGAQIFPLEPDSASRPNPTFTRSAPGSAIFFGFQKGLLFANSSIDDPSDKDYYALPLDPPQGTAGVFHSRGSFSIVVVSTPGAVFSGKISLYNGTTLLATSDGTQADGSYIIYSIFTMERADLIVEVSGNSGTTGAYTIFFNSVEYFDGPMGTAGNDSLAGSPGLVGGAGDDTLTGSSQNDMLHGGPGSDSLRGGPGDDLYVDVELNDIVTELNGAGTDTVWTRVADYTLPPNVENVAFIGTGAFRAVGTDSANALSGGAGDDQLFGGLGADTLNGGEGADYLNGGVDDDFLFGDAGDDTLLGDAGSDYLNAGIGDDLIMGGFGNDTVLGSQGNDYVNGQDGDDLVFGGEGSDTVVGDPGNDYVNGEGGNDTVLGGAGNDTVLGGEGSDYINGGADNDHVFGGNGADVLIGDDGNDYLNGEIGDDIVFAGSGNDTLLGADGNDYLAGGDGNDNLTGGLGDDTLFAGAGSDYLKGDAGDDFFIFEANFGTSLIIDFETGTPAHHDFILFKGGVFVDSADVLAHAVQQATNVVITASTGDSLTLANVQLANLVADDFRFA
jgi:Ca2+-binding RTX toxin-like protein